MENNKKHIDLGYLKQLSNGSEEFIDKMIGIFIEQTPEAISNLEKFLKEKDWKALRGIAHKMKSSVSIMGIKKIEGVVADLENYAEKEINLDQIPSMIEKIKSACLVAIEELKVER